MGILSTDVELFDPLMEEMWEVWPQSWGDNEEQRVRTFGQELLGKICARIGYFHDALSRAVVATHISNKVIPDDVYNDVDKVTDELAKIVRELEPSAKYLVVSFGSSISGGDSCIPNINICFDSEWFGVDFRTDKYGPWHQRHAKVSIYLKYKVDKYRQWGGTSNAPKYSDLYPAVMDWPQGSSFYSESFKQRQHEFQIFFPEGEQYNYPRNDKPEGHK